MKVTQRLYLAALPSVLGVIVVAALAYWGQFAHAVPESFLIVAAIATVSSMVWSWINVRHVAERVERLARQPVAATVQNPDADELDVIADVVGQLNSAVQSEQKGRLDDQAALGLRRTQYARVLADIADSAIRGVNEIRLPLHILLENHFGELNENQEEMLGAARAAAELIDRDLEALQELARLDLGELQLRADRIFPADLLHAILPSLGAVAQSCGVVLHADVAALIPPIITDGIRLQGALLTVMSQHTMSLPIGTELSVALHAETGAVVLTLTPGASAQKDASPSVQQGVPQMVPSIVPSIVPLGVQLLLARRIIVLAGGAVHASATALAIHLPP